MIFGTSLDPPKKPPPPVKRPFPPDIKLPCIQPSSWAHYARQPNTDYHVKFMQYKQALQAADIEREIREKASNAKDKFEQKFIKHSDQRLFKNEIEKRVKERLEIYEKTIEERRTRLRELLGEEECAHYRETVENAKRLCDSKFGMMKRQVEELKAKKEAERLKVVEQKRLQQYMDRCELLRTNVAQKRLVESKNSNLQQMRENEQRREAERELDKFWGDLTRTEQLGVIERDRQDAINKYNKMLEMKAIWEIQMAGKDLLKEEKRRVALEDRQELDRLMEQIRREEIEELDKKRRQRDKAAQELLEQIKANEEINERRRKAEQAVDDAFNKLTQIELDKEKAKIKDTTTQAKREMAIYRENLKKLEEERRKEEEYLSMLLDEQRKSIERKQDHAKCDILKAKEALQKNVLEGRAQQVELKKQEAEYQLKLKEAENELLRMSIAANERLEAEMKRKEKESALLYNQQLKEQAAYNELLR
ncbi:cilia- and flagella-associated protein 53, partial [Agrilus planipennis]|uniref:Cilia- and flagella-associated protein 53 n=1 Tax=Agrilus planipennis TaxID=224129 RepID=A0A1W4WYQ2_AGRPL